MILCGGLVLGAVLGTTPAGTGGAAAPTGIVVIEGALAIIAIGATVTVVQRILHTRVQARAAADHGGRRAGELTVASISNHQPPAGVRDSSMAKKNGSNGVSGNGNGTKGAGGAWAGSKRKDGKVRVAIVGVGNCASSLVQGRYYYEDAKETDFVPGLMHVSLGGYHVRDIEFVAAFDIDKNKVGKDLSEAIYPKPNNTYVFQQVPHLGVKVDRGMTHDGLGKYLSQIIEKAPGPTADIVGILKEREVDVMVSYLPVGSEEATKWYVEQALKAGVGFVNAIPVFIGREPYWQRRFAEEGLPIIGDDIKSQVGATITHRVLTRLFMDRGVRLDRTYQLNFGGNTDFLNMLERERLESKKISKTNAVTSMLDYELDAGDVHVGPSRPRAVAPRPQVVLHPDGGHDLRRRAAQRRAQARGLGQPEQRRRHHRRHPLPEAGPGPRPEGDARRPVELLHEEPARSSSTTTSPSTASRRSSAARTTRPSSGPRSRPSASCGPSPRRRPGSPRSDLRPRVPGRRGTRRVAGDRGEERERGALPGAPSPRGRRAPQCARRPW